MFKKKHKYQITFSDGNQIILEGYSVSVWDDDTDQTKGEVWAQSK